MLSAKEANIISSKSLKNESRVNIELNKINDTIKLSCDNGEYHCKFILSRLYFIKDGNKVEFYPGLVDTIKNRLKNYGYKVNLVFENTDYYGSEYLDINWGREL